MTIARAYLTVLFCSLLMLGGATAAKAQSAQQRQALHQEMAMIVSGMRAVSGCPELIEDWEYTVLSNAASNLIYQLKNTYYLPASLRRSLYSQGDAKTCDNTETKQEAAKLRAYAHSRWLGLSRAFLGEPTCPKPSENGLRFLKAFEKNVIVAYQRKRAPGPSFSEIAAYSKNIAPVLRQGCQNTSVYFRAQTSSLAPLTQMEKSLIDEDVRQRVFDFNTGFTLGLGDAPDLHWARKSGVVAKRSQNATRREIVAKYSACGGAPLPNPLGLTLEVKCIARLNAAGTLAIEIIPKNPKVKLTAVTLDVLDLRTGQPITSRTGNAGAKGRTATVSNALELLAQAPRYSQIHIRLILKKDREAPTPLRFHYSADVKGPATVAAIDFVKAAQYAFSPSTKDLGTHGIVASSADAYELEEEQTGPQRR